MCIANAIRIRDAAASDRAACAALRSRQQSAFEAYPAVGSATAPEGTGVVHTLVLEWSGTVMGLAEWTPLTTDEDTVRILTLAVSPALEGAGMARHLLAAVRTAARNAGRSHIEAVVPLEGLPAANRLGARPQRPVIALSGGGLPTHAVQVAMVA